MSKLTAKLSRGAGSSLLLSFQPRTWGEIWEMHFTSSIVRRGDKGQLCKAEGVPLRQPRWREAGSCWYRRGASGGAGADSFMPVKYQPAAALSFPAGSFASLGSELGRAGCCRGAAELRGAVCPHTLPYVLSELAITQRFPPDTIELHCSLQGK